jgi:hypothetical protein
MRMAQLILFPVSATISDDGAKPGLKGSTTVVFREEPHHAEQCFLAGVLGLFSIAGFQIGPSTHRRPPMTSQVLQCVSVTNHRSLDSLLFKIISGHVCHHHIALLRDSQNRLVFFIIVLGMLGCRGFIRLMHWGFIEQISGTGNLEQGQSIRCHEHRFQSLSREFVRIRSAGKKAI